MDRRKEPKQPRAPAARRRSLAVIGAVAVGLAGSALWLIARAPADDAAPTLPVSVAQAPAPGAEVAAMPAPAAPPAPASAGGAQAVPAPVAPLPPMPWDETPAETLRKVQLGLDGGSAQDVLHAAHTLEQCANALKAGEGLFAARDAQGLPHMKKLVEAFGPITNEQIEHVQRDQRRCQVFDAATLARRGELFQRAYEGGAQGAALAYLSWLTGEGRPDQTDPALMAGLRTEVRQAAEAGDIGSLYAYVFSGAAARLEDMGVSRVQQQGFQKALFHILDAGSPDGAASMRALAAKLERLAPAPPAPLTAEQQREVDALAQRVVEAWRQRSGPGG